MFVISGILIISSIVGVVVLSARRQHPKTKHRREWLTSIPELGSKVKHLQIINPRIVRQDTDFPAVAFEIWNNSNRAVMAIEVSCGSGSLATDGLEDDENPNVIIEPYGTLPVEMNELTPGNPIVITAAIFDDNKEEGEKFSLDRMHRIRARKRDRLKDQKEQPKPQRSATR